MKKKVSIIGANGYIGRHLVHYFNKEGFEIFAYDIQESLYASLPSSIYYKQIDVTNKNDCALMRYDVDYFFIFSGITGTYNGFDEYEKFLKVNELGLLHILDQIKSIENKPHVVFPSTRLVYKGFDHALEETANKEAKTVYAVNKIAAELYIQAFSNSFEIPYTIFRICVPYGNLLDDDFSYGTIGFFYKKAIHKENIVLFGNGGLKRTFTNIEYLCSQIISALPRKEIINEVYNIDGEEYSLRDVAEMFAQKSDIGIEYIDWPQNHLLIESGSTVFDSSKILNLIDVVPKNNLLDWVNNTNF